MTCLNCCALPPADINKLRYVSSPSTTLFTRHGTLQGSCTINTLQKATSCPVLLSCLWWQNIPVNGTKRVTCREVKCTCPHKDLLTAHLGPALCPFSCIRLSLSIQHCGIVQRWSLHCVDRGTNESWHWEYREAYFTYTHTEMCWGCGNVYIRLSDVLSAGAVMRTGGRTETVH